MRITRFEFTQLHDFRPRKEDFSFNALVEEIAQEEVAEPIKATFNEVQLEEAKAAARKQGYNEGFEAGSATISRESQERERDINLAIENLTLQLRESHASYDHILAEQSRDIHRFVLAIAHKVAGEALQGRPDLAIQELIHQCLPILVQKPKVTLEANNALIALLEGQLKPMLERAGFEGEIAFRPNDALTISDARLEWSGGIAERNTQALWKGIEEMLAHTTFFPDTNKEINAPRS